MALLLGVKPIRIDYLELELNIFRAYYSLVLLHVQFWVKKPIWDLANFDEKRGVNHKPTYCFLPISLLNFTPYLVTKKAVWLGTHLQSNSSFYPDFLENIK